MEPMVLGSTGSSPTSEINPHFLPGYLMGDHHPPSSPIASPPRANQLQHSRQDDSFAESRSIRQKLFGQSFNDTATSVVLTPTVPEKSGPPTTGLFDTIEQVRKPTVLSSTVAHLNDSVNGFNESLSRIHPEESLNCSRTFSPSYVEKIDTCWVTVFGFPPSMLNLVISWLSEHGKIVDRKMPPQGNWVHLKFSNFNEVARVLAFNGKCVGKFMIGVQLYREKSDKENVPVFTTPRQARSLKHSWVSPQAAPNAVVASPPVPQKSTGIVTKAIEYVFGW
ncbi:nucleoporin Nup35 [Cylas formicarius]|uniref:nucleoporin Nup35 n=1 Tax=Cylas formicarius TaxID=197179 RepID=UPI002958AE25|nr:nucleoporin Nup35 [Cylas formicarius]XP_060524599.1 nucleoporin Nup35 [Cylas formicarius]XP_060524600.1 nucleoporin Nup35 [Cylas formicarius]